MGFFSWKTQDTGKSISNIHSIRGVFPVYMIDDKGNVWEEKEYNGYGDFGGKDYYELVAEMNGGGDRYDGIVMEAELDAEYILPNLVEDPDWIWGPEGPERCPHQGFFYPESE